MGAACWAKVEPHLRGYPIDMPKLPGHGDRGDSGYKNITFTNLRQLATSLVDSVPDDSIWVGWSLGGLIAQMIAVWYPEKVHHLVCVCSSPRFIAANDWQYGIPHGQFDRFACKFEADCRACEREFIALQAVGDANQTVLRKRLRECIACPRDAGELKAGLGVLAATDMREAIAHCECPVSFIAGENDCLASTESLKMASQLVPDGRYDCIPEAAHAPMLSSPVEFVQALERCLRD